MENAFVYRITHDTNEARLNILGIPNQPGMGARVFRALADSKIHVDMILYNNVADEQSNLSFLIWKKDIPAAKEVAEIFINDVGGKGILVEEDFARISIIGRGLHNPSGIVAEMFAAFGNENINMQMISTSERRVSCLVKAIEVERAVWVLIKQFKLDDARVDSEISGEKVDFSLPLDAPFDYMLTNEV